MSDYDYEKCAASGHQLNGGRLGTLCAPCVTKQVNDLRTALTAAEKERDEIKLKAETFYSEATTLLTAAQSRIAALEAEHDACHKETARMDALINAERAKLRAENATLTRQLGELASLVGVARWIERRGHTCENLDSLSGCPYCRLLNAIPFDHPVEEPKP